MMGTTYTILSNGNQLGKSYLAEEIRYEHEKAVASFQEELNKLPKVPFNVYRLIDTYLL
jgi:hypothetical protein